MLGQIKLKFCLVGYSFFIYKRIKYITRSTSSLDVKRWPRVLVKTLKFVCIIVVYSTWNVVLINVPSIEYIMLLSYGLHLFQLICMAYSLLLQQK